jgi:hypothetical protein
MVRTVLLAALALAGCGWPEPPDFMLSNGLAVSVHTTRAEWAHSAEFPATITALTTDAVVWWGGSAETLRGWELVFSDERPCDGANGCAEDFRDAMIVYVGDLYADCFPQAGYIVWHEIGHVAIGDGDHHDPRWEQIPVPAGPCVMPPPRFHS